MVVLGPGLIILKIATVMLMAIPEKLLASGVLRQTAKWSLVGESYRRTVF